MAIEREKILDAALALLNDVGLEQLTTRKLAERLGVQQPALYWHFKNKSALLDALNEVVLDRFHERRLPRPGESWDDFTLAHARSFRKALVAVRDGARLNAGTRPSARQFADAERQLELYVATGFTPEQALAVALGVARYVTGFVLEEQDERARVGNDSDWGGGNPMDELSPFPILLEAIRPMIEGGAINTETVFETGLGFMIEGIRASLRPVASVRTRRRRRS